MQGPVLRFFEDGGLPAAVYKFYDVFTGSRVMEPESVVRLVTSLRLAVCFAVVAAGGALAGLLVDSWLQRVSRHV